MRRDRVQALLSQVATGACSVEVALEQLDGAPVDDDTFAENIAAVADAETREKLDRIGEFIEFKTGKEILAAAQEVQAEQRAIGEQLGRVLKK